MKPYYDDGRIVIYNGDCREVMADLDAGSVDVVFTDPPFNVPVKYQDVSGHHPRSWGDLSVMEPWLREVLAGVRRIVGEGAHVYACCDDESYPLFFRAGYSLWPQSQALVWYKPTGRRGRGWLHSFELVLHLRTPTTQYTGGFRQDVVGVMPVRTLKREHPAEKPGDLWTFLYEGVPHPDPLILDPFLGGGSVLFWARERGLRAVGIEIEERYCEVSARRLSQTVLSA